MELFLNRSSFALLVALLVHLLFMLIFWILGTLTQEVEKPKEKEHKIKISLKEMPKKAKEVGAPKIKQTPPPTEIAPPMPKGSQLKEVVTKPLLKHKPQQAFKTPELNKPQEHIEKVIEKPSIEPLPATESFIPLVKNEPKEIKTIPVKEKDPMAWLSEDRSSQEIAKEEKATTDSSNISNNIKELYGDQFGKLTPGQQQYILDNQEIMRRITQQVLNRVARVNLKSNLHVNRNNVIEFYLHPNGDMTDFRFISKSGYYELDDTTKETIEYAYSRYPRPSEKTLIRYIVYYNLGRY